MKQLLIFLVFLAGFDMQGQTYFRMKEKYTDVHSANNCAPYCNPDEDLSTLPTNDPIRAAKAFAYISGKSGLQFNYPQSGCPERAIAMHYLLDSLRISNARIWFFSPSLLRSGSSEQLYINDKNKLIDDAQNRIYWPFHVAPCLLTKDAAGKIDTLVCDPAINSNRLLEYKEWMKAIGNHEIGEYCFLKSNFYQFNTGNGIINGFFYPYEGFSFENKWVEKTLAMNDVAVLLYRKYFHANRGKQPKKQLVVLKELLGNSAIFYAFLNRSDATPQFAKLAVLLESNSSLVKEIWALHDKRLAYWVLRMNRLRPIN